MSRQTRALVALSIAAVAVAAAVLPSAGTAADPVGLEQLELARVQQANCAVLATAGTSSAQRARGRQCVADQQVIIDALSVPSTAPPIPSGTTTPTISPPGSVPPSVPPTSLPPPGTSPPVTSPAPAAGFPNAATTGVPAGWVPTTTRSTDLRVTTAGTIVQDLRLTNGADILVDAPNVTIRRVELLGGRIDLSPGSVCHRTLIERATFRRPAGTVTDADQEGAITPGGWTAVGIHMDGVTEGLRAGMKSACGANNISDSFLRIQAPDVCADWHGDGIQGYDGGPVTVSNVAITFQERGGCGGTAPFFYPHSQGNTSATVDGLLVQGGGFSFRLGMPATVRGLAIVDGSWGYGPIDVRCSAVSAWEASIVRVDADNRVTATVRAQACNTESGG